LKITKLQQEQEEQVVVGTNTSQVGPDHRRNVCLLRRNGGGKLVNEEYGVALAILSWQLLMI